MNRLLEPEWLDRLSPDDPRAMVSRRDLVRVNWLMRQNVLVARMLGSQAPTTLLEMGCGDGRFLLAVAKKTGWRDVTATLVDLHDIVTPQTLAGFMALGWRVEIRTGDIFDVLATGIQADVICANLFLHHFPDDALARLFTLAAGRTSRFVACEPRRNNFALLGAHLLGAVGCNAVTRHDAVVSVRAGFAGQELSALWPQGQWTLREKPLWPFSHGFIAERP